MATRNIFTKFDKEFNVKALKEDLKTVGTGDRQFKEVPFGTYEVKVEKMELAASRTGKPMLSCWMKILNGEYQKSRLFMNQVVNTAFGLHTANAFLRTLESGVEIAFESFAKYHDLILNIHEAIDGKYEYAVEYGETGKGFKTFKVTEVFEVE